MILRRGLQAAVAVVLLALAFLGGVYADQAFPDVIPALGGTQRGQLDQASLGQAVRIVQARYYDPKLDYRQLSEGTVRGLVQALNDPYSSYLDPQQYRAQQDSYAGRHQGMIGVFLSFQGAYPVVTGLVPGSPALKAGLASDDVLLAADGRDLNGVQAAQASQLIRGPAGTPVTLRVRRAGQELDVTVTRADFRSPTVQSLRLEDGVLYLRIYQFGDTTKKEFDAQLRAGLPGARGVVLDLRDDGGGFVDTATAVISGFVASGEAYERRGRDQPPLRTFVSGDHPAASVPLAVLVNGNTASAAEIVAGSLQEHRRAQLVGEKTFGKGSIQEDFPLSGGGDLHLTVEHWYLPGGRSIDGSGLSPDVAVPLPDARSMFDVVQPSRGHAADAQLNRALQILEGR